MNQALRVHEGDHRICRTAPERQAGYHPGRL